MAQLVTSVSFPLYFLQPGKPDPSVPFEQGGARVLQARQKGPTCWYYAMKASMMLPPATETRKKYSNLRKQITYRSEKIKLGSEMVKDIRSHICRWEEWEPGISDRDALKGAIPRLVEIYRDEILNGIYKKEKITNFFDFILSFQSQTEFNNMMDYFLFAVEDSLGCPYSNFSEKNKNCFNNFIRNLNRICEINESAINCNENSQELSQQKRKQLAPLLQRVQKEGQVPKDLRTGLSELFILGAAFNDYGFQAGGWDPSRSIDQLIMDLKLHGVLWTSGLLGRGGYESTPEILRKIEGRNIYHWKEESRQKKNCEETHAIVVIGAEKQQNSGLVYYVDPNSQSDPKNREGQRIYTVPYEDFRKNVVLQFNVLCIPQNIFQLVARQSSAYVFYHPSFYFI